MKEIKLTQGYVALVDDEDFEWLSQFKWYAKKTSKERVEARKNIKIEKGEKRQAIQVMHRFVLSVTDPKILIDHKDCNALNNQRGNLREATVSQNQSNAKLRNDNTSGFKGVHRRKTTGLWRARIQVNEKRIQLGDFTDPLEATCAYDMAAVKYFGEFAHCNFARPN